MSITRSKMPSLQTALSFAVENLRRSPAPEQQSFVAAYNNEPGQRRHRNRSSRTDVMVKGSLLPALQGRGLVALAGMHAASRLGIAETEDVDVSFERFVDIGIRFGGRRWWEGECGWLIAAEVENDANEQFGTLRDLTNVQALAKWAVFYENDATTVKKLEASLRKVLASSREFGFQEHPGTIYEIALLPNQIGSLDDLIAKAKFFASNVSELLVSART